MSWTSYLSYATLRFPNYNRQREFRLKGINNLCYGERSPKSILLALPNSSVQWYSKRRERNGVWTILTASPRSSTWLPTRNHPQSYIQAFLLEVLKVFPHIIVFSTCPTAVFLSDLSWGDDSFKAIFSSLY